MVDFHIFFLRAVGRVSGWSDREFIVLAAFIKLKNLFSYKGISLLSANPLLFGFILKAAIASQTAVIRMGLRFRSPLSDGAAP